VLQSGIPLGRKFAGTWTLKNMAGDRILLTCICCYYIMSGYMVYMYCKCVVSGGRDRECLKRSFVKTNHWMMLFDASNVLFQRLEHCKKLENANTTKSRV